MDEFERSEPPKNIAKRLQKTGVPVEEVVPVVRYTLKMRRQFRLQLTSMPTVEMVMCLADRPSSPCSVSTADHTES
mgnify:CR=1 FL=1